MYWRVLVIISAMNSEGLGKAKVHLQCNGFTVHFIKGYTFSKVHYVTWWQLNVDINIFMDPMKFSSHFCDILSSQSYSV